MIPFVFKLAGERWPHQKTIVFNLRRTARGRAHGPCPTKRCAAGAGRTGSSAGLAPHLLQKQCHCEASAHTSCGNPYPRPPRPPLGKGAINPSDASHISPYTGEVFYSLAPPTPANLPRDRCRFPSYKRPTAHAPSARNFRRLRTLTAGADSPSPAKWRAHPCG